MLAQLQTHLRLSSRGLVTGTHSAAGRDCIVQSWLRRRGLIARLSVRGGLDPGDKPRDDKRWWRAIQLVVCVAILVVPHSVAHASGFPFCWRAENFHRFFGTSEVDQFIMTRSERRVSPEGVVLSIADSNGNFQLEMRMSTPVGGRIDVVIDFNGHRYTATNVDRVARFVGSSVWPSFHLVFIGDSPVSIDWQHPDGEGRTGHGPKAAVALGRSLDWSWPCDKGVTE